MEKCKVCGKDVEEVYVTFNQGWENPISGHKHCIMNYNRKDPISLHPFADEEEIDRLREERDRLISSLDTYGINQDEKRFIIRKLRHITEKMVEKARYFKDLK